MKTHRFVIGIVVALALSAVLAGGCQRKERAGEHYSKEEKFSIILPASWTPRPGEGMEGIFFCPVEQQSEDFAENLVVSVDTFSRRTSLEDYVNACEQAFRQGKKLRAYRKVSGSDFAMDNVKGRRLVCTYSVDGQEVQAALYITVKGTRGYVVIGTATPESFSKFEATFDECARTFRAE